MPCSHLDLPAVPAPSNGGKRAWNLFIHPGIELVIQAGPGQFGENLLARDTKLE